MPEIGPAAVLTNGSGIAARAIPIGVIDPAYVYARGD